LDQHREAVDQSLPGSGPLGAPGRRRRHMPGR
jgi:hypothetical protein